MVTRSDSTTSEGIRLSPTGDSNGKYGTGKGLKKKFQKVTKLFGGNKSPPATSSTDGHHSPVEEEPLNGQLTDLI